MKTFLIAFLISFQSMACDWSTIDRQGDKFIYSTDCHRSVGKLVQTEPKQKEQIAKLTESLTFKDLALQESNSRADLWKKEAEKQQSYLQKHEKLAKMNKIIWFAAGVVTVIGGAWAANQLR